MTKMNLLGLSELNNTKSLIKNYLALNYELRTGITVAGAVVLTCVIWGLIAIAVVIFFVKK